MSKNQPGHNPRSRSVHCVARDIVASAFVLSVFRVQGMKHLALTLIADTFDMRPNLFFRS